MWVVRLLLFSLLLYNTEARSFIDGVPEVYSPWTRATNSSAVPDETALNMTTVATVAEISSNSTFTYDRFKDTPAISVEDETELHTTLIPITNETTFRDTETEYAYNETIPVEIEETTKPQNNKPSETDNRYNQIIPTANNTFLPPRIAYRSSRFGISRSYPRRTHSHIYRHRYPDPRYRILTPPAEQSETTTSKSSYYPWGGNYFRHDTTTPKRPYNSWWRYGYKAPSTPTYQYNDTIIENETTTLRSSYYPWGGNYFRHDTTTPKRPYNSWWRYGYKAPSTPTYQYNDTIIENETTTLRSSYYPWGGNYFRHDTTTPKRPYNSWWRYGYEAPSTPTYQYNDTIIENETTTLRSSYYPWGGYNSWWRYGYEAPSTPTYQYNDTIKENETTTLRPSYYPWGSNYFRHANTRPYWWGSSSKGYSSRYENTTDQNVAQNPTEPTSHYGVLTDLLKKITGAISRSATYIAPNSNITNLAVAHGDGNMFFFVNK